MEADVVVPVEHASTKAEFAARTIRPKILRLRDHYLSELRTLRPRISSLSLAIKGDIDVASPLSALSQLKVDGSVKRVARFRGGENKAQTLLRRFIRQKLGRYIEGRRDLGDDGTSMLSPHLHFGQISALQIALAVQGGWRTRNR